MSVYSENLLLDRKNVLTEMDAGEACCEFRAKWNRSWSKRDWQKAIRGKKKASELCAHCGANTIDGCISTVEKVFCLKCEPFIEKYKKEYTDRVEAFRIAQERREANRRKKERDEVDAKLSGAFHWRDDWFFKRQSDGSVAVMHKQSMHNSQDYYLSPSLLIPRNEWASIVCSVSSGGETSERWDAVQDFHGRDVVDRIITAEIEGNYIDDSPAGF